ncbi:DUF1264 domain-containing protein [Sphingobacterium sp.]|uniref:DUF1264 domain-containing protein n=1 Tax=Sphingobacterium sp. TaxID=341027 RepID=UPI0031D0775C
METDQERSLPVGAPMIMMGFTKDGQLHPDLIQDRDKRFDISTAEKREQRKSIPNYAIDPLANEWEQGQIRQFVIGYKADSVRYKH